MTRIKNGQPLDNPIVANHSRSNTIYLGSKKIIQPEDNGSFVLPRHSLPASSNYVV